MLHLTVILRLKEWAREWGGHGAIHLAKIEQHSPIPQQLNKF